MAPQPPLDPKARPSKEGEPISSGEAAPKKTLFGDLAKRRAGQSGLLNEAQKPREEREKEIKARLENEKDPAVESGILLGRKLDEAGKTGTAELTEEEANMLGFEEAKVSKPDLVNAILKRRRSLMAGRENIFDASGNADIAEGERRRLGTGTLITLQAASMEHARLEFEKGNVRPLLDLGVNLDQLPPRVLNDLVRIAEEGELNDRLVLGKLVSLNILPIPRDKELLEKDVKELTALQRIARRSLAAEQMWESIKNAEAEQAKRAAEEQRQKTHEERVKTLEDDTYNVSISAGRQAFGSIISAMDTAYLKGRNVQAGEFGFRDFDIRLEGRDQNFRVSFASLVANPSFQKIFQESTLYGQNNGVELQLRVLNRFIEDNDLFGECVDTLAKTTARDWTGWGLSDYQAAGQEHAWRANWEATLRRTINGYTIGLLESAVEYNGPKLDTERLAGFDSRRNEIRTKNIRRGVVVTAVENLFEETDMTEGVYKDHYQEESAELLSVYRDSLEDVGRFDAFFEVKGGNDLAGVIEDARRNVSRRADAKKVEREKKQALELETAKGLDSVRIEVERSIDSLDEYLVVDLSAARAAFSDLIKFGRDQGVDGWIARAGSKAEPVLRVVQNMQTLEARETGISRELAGLREKGAADQERMQALQRELNMLKVKKKFLSALEVKVESLNNRARRKEKGGFLKGEVGYFVDDPRYGGRYFTEPTYGTAEGSAPNYERNFESAFGSEGAYSKVKGLYGDMKEELGKEGISFNRRQEILAQLRDIKKKLDETTSWSQDGGLNGSARSMTENYIGDVTIGNEIGNQVGIFIRERLRPHLEDRGLYRVA